MKTFHPKIVSKTATAVMRIPSEMIASRNSRADCVAKYVMMNATQITRTAKEQKEISFASLKFPGYLKLSTPKNVDSMMMTDSYTIEGMINSSG